MAKVSVVIPVYNGLKHLTANLPSVVANHPDEIIVVDDASTDSSADYVRRYFPQVKLVINPINLRFPKTANIGFKHASGDVVLLLNQDVSLSKQAIAKSLPHFQNPKVFAVTLAEADRSWAKASFTKGFLQFTNGEKDNIPHPSFWASGGSAVFRKSIWDQLGGFDTIFTPGYYEDLDVGFRARKRGYTIIWEPKSAVIHEAESTHAVAFTRSYLNRIKDRNYLLVQWKNLSPAYLSTHLRYLCLRVLSRPGFIIPILMALPFLPHIVSFRHKEKTFIQCSDKEVFNYLNHD